MVKDSDTVVKEFYEVVNMTASELEKWIETDDAKDTGQAADDGSGKSIGIQSAEQIIKILKSHPKEEETDKYEQDEIDHMRKVVAYNKRHLAQEGKAKQDPDSKSARSLKNWGHDPQKA